VHGSQRGAPY